LCEYVSGKLLPAHDNKNEQRWNVRWWAEETQSLFVRDDVHV